MEFMGKRGDCHNLFGAFMDGNRDVFSMGGQRADGRGYFQKMSWLPLQRSFGFPSHLRLQIGIPPVSDRMPEHWSHSAEFKS